MLLDIERQMLPRWRNSRLTASLGELDSLKNGPARPLPEGGHFSEKLQAWRNMPTMAHAVEIVSAGIVLGREDQTVDAAKFILSHDLHKAPGVQAVARTVLTRVAQDVGILQEPGVIADAAPQAADRVRALRKSTRNDPRNSLAWTDLSREYAVLGLDKKSQDAISVALMLEPGNRFILRSAARLYVHLGQPDVAHDLLRRQPATRYDPWLLCVEIAVATLAERSSRFVKDGHLLIERSQHTPRQTAELAATLATLELNAGDKRHAKKLFSRSLIDPNENTVAQAEWASRQKMGVDCSAELITIANSYEARAYEQCQNNNWRGAVENCILWWLNEPFSSVPVELASYLAVSTFEDPKLAEQFARAGLRANPKNSTLLNNLTVSLLLQDRITDAENEFNKIDTSGDDEEIKTVALATRGMIHFRKGEHAEGQRCYLQAIEQARAKKQTEISLLAVLYFGREELVAGLINPDDFDGLLERTRQHSSLLVQAVSDMLRINYLTRIMNGDNVAKQLRSILYTSPYLDQPIKSRTQIPSVQVLQLGRDTGK